MVLTVDEPERAQTPPALQLVRRHRRRRPALGGNGHVRSSAPGAPLLLTLPERGSDTGAREDPDLRSASVRRLTDGR